MVPSRRMRPTRDAPLLGALALTGAALFAGGGLSDSSLPWLTAGALAICVVALALRGVPGGSLRLLPLAALAAWCGIGVAWSTLPDRSWDYANRVLVYLLFALVGLWLADRRRELAAGLAALLAAVALWALAGLVFPGLNAVPTTMRLAAPVGLWNQLAVLGAFALPLALWAATTRRVAGTLLAYVWLVALVLTLSRGGIAVAVLAVLAWLLLSGAAIDGIATLVAAGVPAAVALAVAFSLPGVTSAGEPSHVRWHDGPIFGGVLVAGALVAALLTRLLRPRPTPALRRGLLALLAVLVAAAIVAVALRAGSAWRQFANGGEVGNGGARLTTVGSNFRWSWWQQAWHAFTVHPWHGTGPGTFTLTNQLYRQSGLDVALEPHDLPLQFLSETGIFGFALLLVAAGALLAPLRRRGHELALWLILPAFLLHSLVDVDWDFVAVAGPAVLVAGALVGRPPRERISAFPVLAASGAAVAIFVSLLLPWLGRHWSGQAEAAWVNGNDRQALALARKARAADPLLVEPVRTQALAAATPLEQLGYWEEATRMQPDNPQPWLWLGKFLADAGCLRRAYPALQRFTNLDDHDDPTVGANLKDQALAFVNAGRVDPARCGG